MPMIMSTNIHTITRMPIFMKNLMIPSSMLTSMNMPVNTVPTIMCMRLMKLKGMIIRIDFRPMLLTDICFRVECLDKYSHAKSMVHGA